MINLLTSHGVNIAADTDHFLQILALKFSGDTRNLDFNLTGFSISYLYLIRNLPIIILDSIFDKCCPIQFLLPPLNGVKAKEWAREEV